jgi:NCAIR mutase (PurE)-related protein
LDTLDLLNSVKDGKITPEEAERILRMKPFIDIGFAKVDTQRDIRKGNTEVIYGAGKTPEQIVEIASVLRKNTEGCVMVTRCASEAAEALSKEFKDGVYHDKARIFTIGSPRAPSENSRVCVITAGTSDIPVAEEAAVTAETLGSRVDRIYDAGVAGLHRLLASADTFLQARAIIVVAGMEGALPSVVGGLVSVPVIAVPTSVGYGASFEGLTALLSMMNSCSSGISVVNIDNGFGAGYIANMIDRRTTPQ